RNADRVSPNNTDNRSGRAGPRTPPPSYPPPGSGGGPDGKLGGPPPARAAAALRPARAAAAAVRAAAPRPRLPLHPPAPARTDAARADAVRTDTTRMITAEDKSFPAALAGRDAAALEEPLGSFSTPLLVLDGPGMAHNLQVMADWVAERGLELMPHGKTTMAPVLWHRQLAAGATGITVATGWQADVALRAGVPTVQIANMCLDPALLRRLDEWLAEHPEQELVCWADS